MFEGRKRYILYALNVLLLGYIFMAMTSFNAPDTKSIRCNKVTILIADESTNGFLSTQELKSILEKRKVYPKDRLLSEVNPRSIVEVLQNSPFVNTATCWKSNDGSVTISVTQRLPIIRIKSDKGDDYYLDDKGGVMPNSSYNSDLIIATGTISRAFARDYITHLTATLMDNELWKNLIEQINVLSDGNIELVPRIGNHIIYIGKLPSAKDQASRRKAICNFVTTKMTRLEKFYRYGLSQAGWNKYAYISLEYDNQIICKRSYDHTDAETADSTAVNTAAAAQPEQQKPAPAAQTGGQSTASAASPKPATQQATAPGMLPPAPNPVAQAAKPVTAKKN